MIKQYLGLLLVLLTFAAGAQNLSISGQVKDVATGEPLPSVSILEKGTTNGITTNNLGKFNFIVSSPKAVLVLNFIGYSTKEVALADYFDLSETIAIYLSESQSVLNEIVVTALGLEQETYTVGYTVQGLKPKDIAEVKSPNFVDNLAGNIAGVTVSQGATGVGSTSKITIRGEASFTNNNPLFIVDGIPINNNTALNITNEAAAGFQEVDFGNGAMELNQDDIASVTVLKGPGAAALYGTRASNGAIVVTTKNGSSDKFKVSLNTSTFIESPFQLPQFQNLYGQGNSGDFEFVDGLGAGTNDNITYSWGPRLDQGTLISQFDSPVTLPDGSTVRGGDVAVHGGLPITPTSFESQPDNLKDFYRTGYTTINNIAVSSGFDKGNYRFSVSDLRSESPIPGVNLDRNTISSKLNFTPSKKLKISTTINYTNSRSDNRPSSGYGSENINYSLVAWGPRSLDISQLEDYWQPGLEDLQQYSFNYTFFDNPYFILLENRNSFNRDRLLGSVKAEYSFTNELSLSIQSGMDYSDELRQFRRAYSTNRFQNGAYAEQNVFFRELNRSFLLNYTKSFGNFSFDVSFGGNRMDQDASNTQTQTLSLAQPGIYNFANADSPVEVFQQTAEKRINSFYGFTKIGYKRFLYLEITGRNDWSSALATPISTANTSFFYPSSSLSYIASNHLNLPKVISFAKLRYSYAQVGNDTDPYRTSSAFVAQTAYNSQPTFSAQNTIPNSNLLPERTTAQELGFDIRFFNSRVSIDFTHYNALTENQIISLPVSISSGYTQQIVNGGAVRSRGTEIVLGLIPIQKNNFRWSTQFNFSRNVSTVESLPDEAGTITLAYSRVYDNVNQTVWFQVEEGGEIGDFYGTGYLKNENGDFVIDANGNFIADNSLQKLGNYNPDFILGFNNSFQYKNWDMSFLFDWRQGGEIVSRTLALAGVGGQLIETENRPEAGIVAEGVVNIGTEENPIWEANTRAITAESYYRQFYDRNHEENNVYDASYLKLRQFSLAYTFNSGLFKKGRSLRVALIGRNLFAISNIPHFDPEQLAVQGNNFISGVEDMSYPTSRSYGIKIGFNF